MSDQILTPNKKVNDHIKSVRDVMSIQGCTDDSILMVCRIIDVSYDYGRRDQLLEFAGRGSKEA